MPPPGGDVIGRRRLDPHLDAFRALGADLRARPRHRPDRPNGGLRAGDVFMDEPSVMATENALMAAALTPGTTIIGNAACEPHVQDLARMLVKMGADIRGIGSNVLVVSGKRELGGCTHDVGPDHIEIGSFIALAGVTGGELVHQGHRARGPAHDPPRLRAPRPADGARRRRRHRPRRPELIAQRDVGEYKAKIQDGPWPAFPADLTSIAIALATQCSGSVLIHEWMFENRMIFTDKLVLDGRRHHPRATRTARSSPAPRRLRGERLYSPDIRAGMAMLIAALCAEGRSEIRNIREIDRGYERIDERLRDLGAPDRAGAPAAARRRVIHRIPSGTRDVLPDEMRELRAITDALRGVFERHGYGEVYTPAIEYESRPAPRRRRRRSPPTACSTTTATCSRCART